MFFVKQTKEQIAEYEKFLKIAGSLSNLYSESEIPALYYRVAERVFCKAFGAEDLSRSDVSVDAKKDSLGIGLKTFLAGNHKSLQKVAEFNNDRIEYESLEPKALVKKVSELRNARLHFTVNAHGLKDSIYHCVIREKGKFLIFEEAMSTIDVGHIKNVKRKKGAITFEDGKNQYSFLLSKSTLTKRFVTKPIVYKFDVQILKDPLSDLSKLFEEGGLSFLDDTRIKETLYLPLYGTRKNCVEEKSGLNQWNAGGRDRNISEVYIPVPTEIHKNYPHFFPNQDTHFNLKLPNGKEIESKICQQGGKALMSRSNKELGEWILREVLELKEGELFTDEKMKLIGIDSVRIDKIDDSHFEMSFSETGSYDDFRKTFNA